MWGRVGKQKIISCVWARGGKEENYRWGEGGKKKIIVFGREGGKHKHNRAHDQRFHLVSCPLSSLYSSYRRPGGEILLLFDWLIHMRSYSDWLVFYEDEKIAHPIKMPPRDERGLSIDRKLKFTDLID